MGQREGIVSQQSAQRTADDKLHGGGLEARQIDGPHGADEADGAENADRRKVAYRVVATLFKQAVGHGVGERQRGHVESYAQRVERKEGSEGDGRSGREPISARRGHEEAGG